MPTLPSAAVLPLNPEQLQCSVLSLLLSVSRKRDGLSLQVGCLHSGGQKPGELRLPASANTRRKLFPCTGRKAKAERQSGSIPSSPDTLKGQTGAGKPPTALHALGAAKVSTNSVRQKDSLEPTHRGSAEERAVMETAPKLGSRWCEKSFAYASKARETPEFFQGRV